jgi:hypothetical protein
VAGGLSWRTDSIVVLNDHSHFLGSPLQFGTTCIDLRWKSVPSWLLDDTQMTCRNFQSLRVLGSALRMKAEADSSSRDQKDFICREEKGYMGHAVGPRNRWSQGSGWKPGSHSLFLLPKGRDVSQVQTNISWEEEVSPWPIITFWDLLQSALHFDNSTNSISICFCCIENFHKHSSRQHLLCSWFCQSSGSTGLVVGQTCLRLTQPRLRSVICL